MSNAENAFDHGAAFTAPRKTVPELFEGEAASSSNGLSGDDAHKDHAADDAPPAAKGRDEDGLNDAGDAPRSDRPVEVDVGKGDDAKTGLFAQDDDSVDNPVERASSDATEATPVPAVDPQTRPVAHGAPGIVGKAIDPLRAWIMSGKSPFSGLGQTSGSVTGTPPNVAENPSADKKSGLVSAAAGFVADQPIMAGGVAVTAVLIALGVLRGHEPVAIVTQPVPVQQAAQIAPPAQQTAPQAAVAATPAAMREEILKALEEIDHRLKNVEAEQQRLGAVGSRIANIESATQSLRSQMETSASPQGEIEALRHGLDEVRGVAASLAENMDERLTKLGSVSSLAAPAAPQVRHVPAPHVRKRAPRPASDDSALPVIPEEGRSPVVGTATGSPARGFILATSDKIDVAPGDVLPGYGRVDSVRPAEGGKMVITESGTIFIKTGKK